MGRTQIPDVRTDGLTTQQLHAPLNFFREHKKGTKGNNSVISQDGAMVDSELHFISLCLIH
jgi:hypothetical protein